MKGTGTYHLPYRYRYLPKVSFLLFKTPFFFLVTRDERASTSGSDKDVAGKILFGLFVPNPSSSPPLRYLVLQQHFEAVIV